VVLNLNADSSGYLLKRDRVMLMGKESQGPVRHYLSGISDIESDYPMSGLSFVDGMENITARPVFEQNMAGMK
jgi:hypothetical protein